MSIPLTEFKSDDGFSTKGVINLIISMALASLALGFVANWISQFFYLILLFPLGMGIVLIVVGGMMVTMYKIRNRMLCMLAGIIGGVLTFSSMHYFEYRTFRSETDKDPDWAVVVAMSKMSLEALNQDMEAPMSKGEYEELQTVVAAYEGFGGYLNFAAEQGVEIGRRSSSFNLGYGGTWVYWVLEMGLVAFFVGAALKSSADEPFCVATDSWMDQKSTLQGIVNSPSTVTSHLQSGNVENIPKILTDQSGAAASLMIHTHKSEDPESPNQVLEVVELIPKKDKDPEEKTHARLLAPKEFAEAVTEVLTKTAEKMEGGAPQEPATGA